MKRLTAPPPDWKGPVEIIAELSGYPYKKQIEAAGRSYQELLRRLSGEEVEEKKRDVDEEEDEQETTGEQKAKFESKRHKRVILDTEDYYEILGLGDLRWRATEDDIKLAYKKLVLKYHPDKNANIDDSIFKSISEANEILSDPKKRRLYDSQEFFDDTIPSGIENNDFYGTFGPVFERFSKWSTVRPVPKLGDKDAPYEEVKKFYDFWYEFKSWRDFSFEDEFNPKEAESREEKRWMERQNEREQRKKKKEEASIIRKLTETAERLDPRIKKHKEEIAAEKQRKKEEKAEQARKRKEEAERLAALEREKKELEEKQKAEELAQKQKQKALENKKLRKARSKFRSLVQSTGISVSGEDVDFLCAKLALPQLNALIKTLEKGDAAASLQAVNEEITSVKNKDKEQEKQQKEEEKEQANAKEWTEEELSLLARAIAKYPGAVRDRWQLIADFVGTRSVKEIIAKTKETKTIPNKPVVKSDAYQTFTKTKKVPEREINSPLSVRDDVELGTTAPKATKEPVKQTQPAKQAQPAAKKEADPAKDWTAEDQKRLESALQTYPNTLPDRWDKIAAAIPGKTKKDCILRYKYIVEQIKKQRQQQAK